MLLLSRYQRKGDQAIIKFIGKIIDFPIKMNLGRYEEFVVYKNRKKVIYVEIIRAIYRIIISSFL